MTILVSLPPGLVARAAACACAAARRAAPPPMDEIAERYVKLVLAGRPARRELRRRVLRRPAWKPTGPPGRSRSWPPKPRRCSSELAAATPPAGADEIVAPAASTTSTSSSPRSRPRIAMLAGPAAHVRRGVLRLYDAEAPHKTEAEFQAVLDELERLLPGRARSIDRYAAFRNGLRHSDGQARRGVPRGDRRLPRPHARST